MTDDERYAQISAGVDAFTRGNDPNPGGRFPSGSYLTPDEARERGQSWVSRPGEPQDLRDPYHYQSPDEARSIGMNWATQPSIRQGRSPHMGMTGLYQQMAAQNRLGDLQGYGYDNYAGPLAPQPTARMGALMQQSRGVQPTGPSALATDLRQSSTVPMSVLLEWAKRGYRGGY